MFDTMTMTKVVGAFCGALLVYLLGGWLGEALYHTGGHGEHEQAYVIDTGEEEATDEAAEAEEEQVPFLTLVAQADPSGGESTWRQCQACHQLQEEQNGVGPHLVNIAGRTIGSVEGFSYSGALPEGDWTIENLNGWLENPSEWAPGTSMSYSGISDREDRAELIAYLVNETEGFEMPEPPAETDQAAAEGEGGETEMAAADGSEPADGEGAETETAGSEAAEGETETAAAEADAPAETDSGDPATAEGEASDQTGGATETAASEDSDAQAAEGEAASGDGTETAMVAEEDAAEEAGGGETSAIQAAYEDADPEAGQAVWRQCQACHVADQEQNRVGPHLVGILGREIGSVEGFGYSGALPEGEWTLEELSAWLENPREYAPGTSMAYAGLDDVQDRANVIAYIESLN